MKLTRTGTAALAAAGGTGAFLIAALGLAAGDNADSTDRLQHQLQVAPPATAEQLADLLPTGPPGPPPPYPVLITAAPGLPGTPGAPGTAGAPGLTLVRTITVTAPAAPASPAPTVTITATPTTSPAPQPSPSPTRTSSCVFTAVPVLNGLC